MESQKKDRWLLVSSAAERLACSADWVYRLIAMGRLDALRLGEARGLRVSERSLDRYIEKCRAEFLTEI